MFFPFPSMHLPQVKEYLTSFGEVTESGPCALNTVALGSGITTYHTMAQRGMSFTVAVNNRNDERVMRGGDMVSVRAEERLQPEVNIDDVGDGTYHVEYKLKADLKDEKNFRMRVRLNNKDIKGSPFMVPIRRDYVYVVDGTLQGIGLVSGGVIDGEFMYVALYSQNQVVKVRRETGAQEQRIPVNGQPYAMVIDGDLLFVCLYNTHFVGVYNKETGAMIRMMGGPGVFTNPVGMAQDGEFLYVTEHLGHRVQMVRKANGTTVRRINDDTLRSPFAVLLDDEYIYISSNTGNHVKVYTKENLQLIRTVGEGGGTFLQSPISLTMDEDILFVGCNGNNIVQLYRRGTFEALGTIHNVNQPYGAVTHEHLVYVCCMGASAVLIYRPSYMEATEKSLRPAEIDLITDGAPPIEDEGSFDGGDY